MSLDSGKTVALKPNNLETSRGDAYGGGGVDAYGGGGGGGVDAYAPPIGAGVNRRRPSVVMASHASAQRHDGQRQGYGGQGYEGQGQGHEGQGYEGQGYEGQGQGRREPVSITMEFDVPNPNSRMRGRGRHGSMVDQKHPHMNDLQLRCVQRFNIQC